MANSWIEIGDFYYGVIKGLISLIPKKGDTESLNNMRPITLLMTIYKIFAKMLQLGLQLMLSGVVSPKKTSFLPLTFIYVTSYLSHKPLHWAKKSRPHMVSLKLGFLALNIKCFGNYTSCYAKDGH